MANLRIVWCLALNNFKKWPVNPRIYLLLISLFLYLYSRLAPVIEFCRTFGYGIAPYTFPYIMSEEFSVMLIMFGVVLLFCDAPFIDAQQPYIILRSGRMLWVMAQLLYIVLASALYFLAVILLNFIVLLPVAEFTPAWGKVIGTFAQTSAGMQQGISIPFSYAIMNTHSPASAMFISFLLCWVVSVFIGFIMFVFNSNISRASGAIAASLLIFWQSAVVKTSTFMINYSPVSWVSLAKTNLKGNTVYPSLTYIFVVTGASIALLTLIAVLSFKRRDIEVLKSI